MFRRFRLGWVILGLTYVSTLQAASDDNNFDRVLSAENEPPALHYRARYRDSTGEHSLELWRDEGRCYRVIDQRFEAWVFREGSTEDWRMTVLDRLTERVTRTDRDRLLRQGTVIDWFDLTHGLSRPWGHHRVRPTSPPEGSPAVDSCEHYLLETESGETAICWSVPYHLPLMMTISGETEPVWVIESVDTALADPAIWDRRPRLEHQGDDDSEQEDDD